jgi:hypothetical protein
MASEDNPLRGGKLWIGEARQPGSLFVRADGSTLYEQFRLRVEPRLPTVLRNRAIQAMVVLVYLWTVVALLYAILFAAADGASARTTLDLWSAFTGTGFRTTTASVGQVVVLTAALGLFYAVPNNFPDNPSNSFPFVPELVLFGTLCLMAGIYSPGRRWPIRREERFWYLVLVLFLGYTTFRAIQSGLGLDIGFDPCSAVAPSVIVRLECRLDASFSQNYAWKSIVQSIVVLGIAGMTAFLARTVPGFSRNALAAIMLVGLAHASIGLAAIALRVRQVLPTWIMMNPYADRFTFFIPYPGYVWTQMAPALAVSVWQLSYGSSTRDRLVGIVATILLAAGIAGTQQRGGLLLVGTMVLLALAATVLKSRTGSGFGSERVRLSFCAVLWAASIYPLLMLRSHTGGMFVDFRTRPYIWKAAIDGVMKDQNHRLFGFGYARWAEFGQVSLGTPAHLVLDTAHSLWIRVLFELGAIGLLLAAACVVGAFVIAVRNASGLTGGLFLVSAVAMAFLICATFEEPDFARPVVMNHAFLAGVCCGLPFFRSPRRRGAPARDTS